MSSKNNMSKGHRLVESTKLQALLLCDSFHGGFAPVSDEIPEILFPVCNVPLLHYSLEFLTSQPVSEIFVVSCFKYQLVRQYLEFDFF